MVAIVALLLPNVIRSHAVEKKSSFRHGHFLWDCRVFTDVRLALARGRGASHLRESLETDVVSLIAGIRESVDGTEHGELIRWWYLGFDGGMCYVRIFVVALKH